MGKTIKYLMLLEIMVISGIASGQSTYLPLDETTYHWLDRFDVLFENPTDLHFTIKGISRRDVALMVETIDSLYPDRSQREMKDLQWLLDQNNEWAKKPSEDILEKQFIDSSEIFYTYKSESQQRIAPSVSHKPVFKSLFKTPANLFEVNSGDFSLRVNPLLNFRLAKDNAQDGLLFENQRGISIRGSVDSKVYFHTEILESQARYPSYVDDFRSKFSAVPGAGFYKPYISSVFDFENAVDFLLANAYVGTSISKHVQFELGHGRHFIGNGIRSLFLSDFTTDYFYLKLNTRVWKFHYQNIFGELLQGRRMRGDQLLPKKYFAAHYLSLNILQNLYIGLFETVVFARENQFELQYLNPVILYRTVEGSIGSPDNVLLGLDIKYNLWRKVSLYSQFILDEFKIGEIKAKSGWWANKYALQVGIKSFDILGISHLDAQVEYNVARPYTYSHNAGIAHYSHYSQSLAHPLGANFRESIVKVTYQSGWHWFFTLRALTMHTGEDQDTLNWGSNILLPNDHRVQDYNNEVLQGVKTDITMIGLDISYQLRQGLFLDLFYQYRKQESALSIRNQESAYIGGGIRWNLRRRWNEF